MPAIRKDLAALHREMDHLSSDDSRLQLEASPHKRGSTRPSLPSSPSATLAAIPAKKKKPPNAFILFRSYAIAKELVPVGHQTDVSRMAGELWRELDKGMRTHFFRLAEEEKLRCQMEEVAGVEGVERKRTRTVRPTKQGKAKASRNAIAQMPTPSTDSGLISSVLTTFSCASADGAGSPSIFYPTPPVDTQLPRTSLVELPVTISSPSFAPIEPDGNLSVVGAETDISAIDFEWTASLPASSILLKPYDYHVALDNALGLHSDSLSGEPGPAHYMSTANVPNVYPDFMSPVMGAACEETTDVLDSWLDLTTF